MNSAEWVVAQKIDSQNNLNTKTMACNNNGKTFVELPMPIPGGTAANASYLLALDHYTCGNRKLCSQGEVFPVSADIKASAIGAPVDVGNGSFCQEVLLSGSCTYMPFYCGCQCNICPRTENIYCVTYVPCSSAATPTLTVGNVVASPTKVQPCQNTTNCIAITTTLNVTTA